MTVFGMSWNLRSKNIFAPVAEIALIPWGPLAQKNSNPNFTAPTPLTDSEICKACFKFIVSIATIICFL